MATGHRPAPAVRVLVVEDDKDDTILLSRQLDKAGMMGQVKFFDEGQAALDYLNQDREVKAAQIMVIFLDLKLPGLGGIDLLRQLKSSSPLRHIPVVVMTSSNNPADMEECQRLQVANYVEKPVTFTSFTKAMADVFHSPNNRIESTSLRLSSRE